MTASSPGVILARNARRLQIVDLVALAGKLGSAERRWSGGIFLLGVLQAILGAASVSAPALGFLHGINALAIYAAAALLAHRTWTEHRGGGVGAS